MDSVPSNLHLPSFSSYLRHLRISGSGGPRPGAELANEAGISAGYLTKLEQGTATNPSPQLVDQLATALKADDVARQHLHDLVEFGQAVPGSVPDTGRDQVTEAMRANADSLVPHLAAFVDDAWNIIYANAEYSRIYRHIADPEVGNVLTWLFTVPEAKAIMVDWAEEARLTVAWLRTLMVRHPGSGMFNVLLRRLATSNEFVRMWDAQQTVNSRTAPRLRIHDLDRGEDVTLLAQVYAWPDPSSALQLYLGVRTDRGRAAV
jgi:transcriptional regulator with XRE-family HTH domain